MRVTQKEVLEFRKKAKEKNALNKYQAVEQATVSNELLTNSPEWNIYLQELQAILDKSKEARLSFQLRLEDPEVSDPIEVTAIRNKIFILNERIGILDSVMRLPKDIIETGKEAKLALKDI